MRFSGQETDVGLNLSGGLQNTAASMLQYIRIMAVSTGSRDKAGRRAALSQNEAAGSVRIVARSPSFASSLMLGMCV